MFSKAALVTVALALVASATPIIEEGGVRIELPRRSLTKPNGVFDFEKFKIANARTINKHRQNLLNLEKNVGREAWPVGAEILEPREVPELHKRQSESLTDQEEEEWTGSVSIGSNKQTFTIDFDTGSSDLWVPNANGCSSCRGKKTYNSKSSSTSKSKSGSFSIEYGDGSTCSGPIFTDTVTVAGVSAKTQTFSAVTTLSDEFTSDPADGLLGMGFQSISNLNAAPFFQNAYSQGAVKSNEFSFKLGSDSPSLYLGGADSSLYTGSIEYHAVSGTGFWQTTNAAVSVNGKKIASGFDAIIDSGTTLAYGSPSSVKSVYAQIKGSKLYDSQEGLYTFPCNAQIPTIGFSWGGKTWTISADNFNYGQVEEGSSSCVGGLVGSTAGLGSNTWLLGDAFMKNVYTVFNVGTNSVGFAELA